MALYETDVLMTGDSDYARQLRGAIASELEATSLYEKLAAVHPEDEAELREIMDDEMQHTGKLLKLLNKCCPRQTEEMNKGIEGA